MNGSLYAVHSCCADTEVSNAPNEQVKQSLNGDSAQYRLRRKLSYRKDDRAIRHMYGCPENYRESLTTLMATFLKIFNGLLF